jgi:hypothetical protein
MGRLKGNGSPLSELSAIEFWHDERDRDGSGAILAMAWLQVQPRGDCPAVASVNGWIALLSYDLHESQLQPAQFLQRDYVCGRMRS